MGLVAGSGDLVSGYFMKLKVLKHQLEPCSGY